ncbi:MAG: hypothetical protein KAS67_04095 [Thermoplasmata archaeon]|nr:hypothetical protein [Thermoplasmata archaeon]
MGRAANSSFLGNLLKIISTSITYQLARVFWKIPALARPPVPDKTSVAEKENTGYGKAAAGPAFQAFALSHLAVVWHPRFFGSEHALELAPEGKDNKSAPHNEVKPQNLQLPIFYIENKI